MNEIKSLSEARRNANQMRGEIADLKAQLAKMITSAEFWQTEAAASSKRIAELTHSHDRLQGQYDRLLETFDSTRLDKGE